MSMSPSHITTGPYICFRIHIFSLRKVRYSRDGDQYGQSTD